MKCKRCEKEMLFNGVIGSSSSHVMIDKKLMVDSMHRFVEFECACGYKQREYTKIFDHGLEARLELQRQREQRERKEILDSLPKFSYEPLPFRYIKL